ncbi:MAG: hypothetical protein KatS3mg028_0594 [Bacteroidia bacterium]|nr:MAG: hypothetical protein KatS3mg028_0594 [Bacteroidia bacterium]
MLYTLKDSLPNDSVKQVWTKAFKHHPSHKKLQINKIQPYIFKVYVYQKSI